MSVTQRKRGEQGKQKNWNKLEKSNLEQKIIVH